MSAIATIAIGVVFVLLIGEIDLSVAFVSAVGGVVMTLLLRPEDPGWSWWAAILVALACTTAIGFVQALVITKAGVPSFVVTLALFLFLGSWNDFLWPLIVLADQHLYTLPVAIAAIGREHAADGELMMAAAVVTTMPVLLLFLALQRYYLTGLLGGSIKG